MNKAILITTLVLTASLALSGCNRSKYSNAKILSQDDAKIVVTINKDFSTTVVNANTGERIEPCVLDKSREGMSEKELIKECYPDGHDVNGKILSKSKIIVREGSICATIVVGKRLYVLCQPPHNLGF